MDHNIECHFKVDASTVVQSDQDRLKRVLEKMATQLYPKDHPMYPAAYLEAEKIYRLVSGMTIALAEEVKNDGHNNSHVNNADV